MKNKFLYIISYILLITSCNEQSFQLDAIIQQCYDSKYQQEGFDLKTVIEDYEKLLVNGGILKDDSGKSYLEVYQKIISNKDFSIKSSTFQEYDPWHKIDKEIAITVFKCEHEMIELAKQKDSKWLKILSIFNSPEINENPNMLYQIMVENLSEKDLNSYYFKLKMFHIFDMANIKWKNQSLTPTVSTE